ncbi:hypothetical protein C8R42DRAFT_467635 [Lentinula raphanica]|nr:hypothetical protein C8R42DRAFT_467635 [Lentinula raphanica]
MSCQPVILLSLLALEFTLKMLSAIFSPFFGEFGAIFGFHVTILLRISVLWGENIAYFRRFSRAGFCRSFRGPPRIQIIGCLVLFASLVFSLDHNRTWDQHGTFSFLTRITSGTLRTSSAVTSFSISLSSFWRDQLLRRSDHPTKSPSYLLLISANLASYKSVHVGKDWMNQKLLWLFPGTHHLDRCRCLQSIWTSYVRLEDLYMLGKGNLGSWSQGLTGERVCYQSSSLETSIEIFLDETRIRKPSSTLRIQDSI